MPDQVTGTGADGTTVPVDREDETLIAEDAVLEYPNEFPLRKDLILNEKTFASPPDFTSIEVEGEEPDVYGISFPRSMLPIGADQGYWTSEPLLDLDGDEDKALVRVWLHAPSFKWPQREQHPPGEGV